MSFPRMSCALIGFVALSACGDPPDKTGSNNGVAGNNGVVNNSANNGGDGPLSFRALAATADFAAMTSAYHVVDGSGAQPTFSTNHVGAGDVVVAAGAEHAFVLNRNDGEATIMSHDGSDSAVVGLFGGAASNPQDAVDAGGFVWVSLFGTPNINVFAPNGDEWSAELLDISDLHGDGNPDAGHMTADGEFVLVVLQRLTEFVGVDSSQLLVIDAGAFDVSDALDLGVRNAQAGIEWLPSGDLAVGHTGDFGADDGGILRVARRGAGVYEPGDSIITEEALGGDLLDFEMIGDDEGIAIVSYPDFSSVAVHFAGPEVAVIESITNPGFAGLALVGEPATHVLVGDRTKNQLAAIPVADLQAEPQWIDLGAPPASVVPL